MAKTIKIVQGEDTAFSIQLFADKANCEPYPLTGFTGATGYLPAASGGALPIDGSLVSSDLGKVSFEVSEIQSAALLSGTELDFEVEIDQGTEKTIHQILGKLEVAERLF